MNPVRLIAIVASCLAACDVPIEPGFEYSLSGGAAVVEPDRHDPPGMHHANALPPDRVAPHESAGFLVLDDSPLKPWCSVVLVAPDVAMTSSDCVAGLGGRGLSVGFGAPNRGAEYPVEDVVELARDPRLAAVRMAEPVDGIEPASIALPLRDVCGVESVAFLYVIEDDPSMRWLWSGCFTTADQMLEPRIGVPNCHGDAGAGAFTRDGVLVGLVVAAEGASPCVHRVHLAVPTDGGAFEEALGLSR